MGGHWNVSIQLQQLKKKANNWEKSQTCIGWLAGSRWIHSNLLRCLLNLVLAAQLIIVSHRHLWQHFWKRDGASGILERDAIANFHLQTFQSLFKDSSMSTQQYPFHLLHLDFETLSFYFTTHHIQLMRLLTERKLVLASLQHQLSKFFTRLIDCQSARCKICTFCSLCANCVQTVCKLCKLVFWNSVLRMFFCFFIHFARYSLRHTLHSVQKWCEVWLCRDFPHSQSSSRHSWVTQLILHCTRISICIWETETDLLSWVAIKTWFLATFETRFPRLGDQPPEDRQ